MISTPHVTAIILDETTDSHLIIACDGVSKNKKLRINKKKNEE